MHRDPFDHRDERRVQPSDRAKEAADRWLNRVGGEEAYKRHMAAMFLPSTQLLDIYAARWQQVNASAGLRRLHQATVNERYRELRRLRRQLRLLRVVAAMAVGAVVALVVFYGWVYRH